MEKVVGRLDLDDHGNPRDGVSGPPLDVMSRGPDRRTWSVSAQDRVLESAWFGFAQRHRRPVAVVGSLLLVAVTGYVATRPPEAGEVAHVTVTAQQFVRYAPALAADTLVATYTVSSDLRQVPVEVLGVTGPGLTSPTVDPGAAITSATSVTLGATVSCSDERWRSASDSDYRLRVQRTGDSGVVSGYDVPLGASAHSWRLAVRQRCLTELVQNLAFGHWTLDVSPTGPVVRLSATVSNPHQYPLWLQFDWWTPGSPAPIVRVAPGGSATISTSWTPANCIASLAALPSDGPQNELPIRADVQPLPPASLSVGPDPRVVYLRTSDSTRAAFTARLLSTCPAQS